MHYRKLEALSDAQFKRLCGVNRLTFAEMVEVLRPHLERQGQPGGQNKLGVEDQLLIALEYWREYRSQFHIGISWGVHETTVGRIVRKVEDLLIKCGKFRLPSQRQLYQPLLDVKHLRLFPSFGEVGHDRELAQRDCWVLAHPQRPDHQKRYWWRNIA